MKAVILAAGVGERLEPLTNLRPKPMLPVANRPILEHVVETVATAGFDDVVLVVGYKRDRIQSHFGDGDAWGVSIEYAFQDAQLGTGDAVLQAEPYVDDDFLVMNGDRVFDGALLERVRRTRLDAGERVMAVTKVDEPELFGVVDVDDGYATAIAEKPPTTAIRTNRINAGVYAFGRDVFDSIRETRALGELALTDILAQSHTDYPVRVVPYRGPWLDVSWPWDILTVNGELLDREDGPPSGGGDAWVDPKTAVGSDTRIAASATVQRGTAIGDNVRIGPNVTVSNSVVMDDVTIDAGAVVHDAVVGDNVHIGPNVTIPGGSATMALQNRVHEDVVLGGIVGDNADIGAGTTVEPGSRVGNGATVELHCHVADSIDPHTRVTRG